MRGSEAPDVSAIGRFAVCTDLASARNKTDDLRRAVEISERIAHDPSLPRSEAPRAFDLTEPRDDVAIKLTPKEYDLLAILFRNAGRVVTHRQILSSVWGPAHAEDTQYLRVFIGQLRAKIERDPTAPRIVKTEPGVGYRAAEA